jgi:hypothetical protein
MSILASPLFVEALFCHREKVKRIMADSFRTWIASQFELFSQQLLKVVLVLIIPLM